MSHTELRASDYEFQVATLVYSITCAHIFEYGNGWFFVQAITPQREGSLYHGEIMAVWARKRPNL